MHRKRSVRFALAVVLALGTAALGFSSASGVPDTTATRTVSDLSPGLLTAMQRDLGLSESEARARIAQEATAAKIAPKAEKAAGSAYGGSWFDADKGTLVVGVTSAAKADEVHTTGADVVRVPHTAKALDAVKAKLDARAKSGKAPAAVASWRVDPQSGAVVVDVVKGKEKSAQVRRFLDTARKAGPVEVVVNRIAEAPATHAGGTVGGDRFYTSRYRCSIGFSVHGGFVTAGHCGRPGETVRGWDRSLMGTFRGSSYPGNDYAWVGIGHGWSTAPVVLGWGAVPDRIVRGSREAPIGSSICRSSGTTHWRCGKVLSKNETANYNNGSVVVYGLTKTTLCSARGDSGGAYITGDQAQGVHSGGWGDCNTGGRSWFQPVNEILQTYGLTLHTA